MGQNATDAKETAFGIVGKFWRSYKAKPADTSNVNWLDSEFANYPEIWKDESERRSCSEEVVSAVDGFRASSAELETIETNGGSRADFLRGKIDEGGKVAGVTFVAQYAERIDSAVDEANGLMADAILTKKGKVSQNRNLDGYIAEADHAATFGIDAAAKEKEVHAERPDSREENSADILIKDENGNTVQPYQAKFGKDAKATKGMYEQGDYGDQKLLAPKGQAEEAGGTDRIECDGVESTPRSKEEMKQVQKDAQENGKIREYDWNDANATVICKHIAKKSAIAGVLAVGFQGARILGRRVWNGITGKENRPFEEDMREFVDSAAKSGVAAAGMTAVCGGLVVASKKGLLGAALMKQGGNVIANVACAAVENLKILSKLGNGEISVHGAMDLAGRTNCALVGSLVAAGKGMAVGSTIGAAFGPVGVAIGGFIGAMVGGIAGSAIGEAMWSSIRESDTRLPEGAVGLPKSPIESILSGAKKCAGVARNVVRNVVASTKSTLRGIGRALKSLFA